MESIFSNERNFKKYESLNENIEVDTLVIGGGITGLLTAYMLQKRGANVTVIEGNSIASGNVQGTTGKITIQHNLIYHKIIDEFGLDKAKEYADLNNFALNEFKRIIKEENINCDFEEKDAYVYSTDNYDEILKEYEAIKKLNINGELVDEIELPIKITKGLKFRNQGQYNPLKFLEHISKDLKIYENTRALAIEGNLVSTNRGDIKANNIVIATHFPFINVPGFYFMRMHQERSYIVAVENAMDIKGMYIDVSKNGYSFRNYENLLFVGGAGERTGKNTSGGSYEELKKVSKELFPDSKVVEMWSSQDCMTMDGLPYIGKFSDSTPNMYIATGFNKWGMTTSMVAALTISDMIMGKGNYENNDSIFSPNRFDLSSSFVNIAKDGMEATKGLIKENFNIPNETFDDIEKGYGGVVVFNDDKVGVYKDFNGEVFVVKSRCPHLGCELQFNKDDLSWDCPCHGSRFNIFGDVIDAPATEGIGYEK